MALMAIITAGGRLPRKMKHLAPAPVKALLEIGDTSLLEIAAAASLGCPQVSETVVVGGEEVRNRLPGGCSYVEQGDTVVDNIYRAYLRLGEDRNDYIIISPDLPFLSAESLGEFISRATGNAEIGFPVVSRDSFLEKFPGAPNFFETMDGSQVTMGSCIYFSGPKLKINIPLMRDMYNARKLPWRLAIMLGFSIIWGYITRSLKAEQLEARLSRLTDAAVRAVYMDDAGIAYDIDNMANYEYARKLIESKN